MSDVAVHGDSVHLRVFGLGINSTMCAATSRTLLRWHRAQRSPTAGTRQPEAEPKGRHMQRNHFRHLESSGRHASGSPVLQEHGAHDIVVDGGQS